MIIGRRVDKKNPFHLRMSFRVFFNNKVTWEISLCPQVFIQSFFPTLLVVIEVLLEYAANQIADRSAQHYQGHSKEIGSFWDGGTGASKTSLPSRKCVVNCILQHC